VRAHLSLTAFVLTAAALFAPHTICAQSTSALTSQQKDPLGPPIPSTVTPGSIDDVSAVGDRPMPGARGMGNWYSTETEMHLGKQYASEIDRTIKFVTDPVVVDYVNRITQNLVRNSDAKIPFSVKVIDSDEINAMAIPGGYLYVNSGLILASDDEAEMASVMAHEIAHVAAHHTAREMTRANYAQLGMIPLVFVSGWAGYGAYEAAQIGIPLTFLQFSRQFEAQADYLSLQYLYKAGYDPQAFVGFFVKYNALIKQRPTLVSKAFATHPLTPERIERAKEEIARILPPRNEYILNTSEFEQVKARLQRIQDRRKVDMPETPSKHGKGTAEPSLHRTGGNSTDPDAGPSKAPPPDKTPILN
jgi:beta-barrel assembly-enhancing protease